MNQQIDASLDVSIPGASATQQEQCPVPINPDSVAESQAGSGTGNIDYALQAACKEELSHGVYPKFEIRAMEYKAKSRELGRPFFVDTEFVMVTIAGDKNSKIDREVSDIDRKRWPALYQAFKNGMDVAKSGTPLEQWPIMTPGQVANLKHFGIFTVEDLANLSDTAIQNVGMGTRELTKKAHAYLESAENTALPQKLTEQIDQMMNQIAALEANNVQLGEAARGAETHMSELQQLREDNQEKAIRLESVGTELISSQNTVAEQDSQINVLKAELTTAKGQATKAKNELEKLKTAGKKKD